MPISPARTAAFDILLRVDQQDAYASELLHSGRLESLSPVDCALTTELVMGVLRWQSRLDGALTTASARSLTKLDAEVLTALRPGAYQLQLLSRIPAHAAINETVELVKRASKRSAAPFANAVLRKIAASKVEVPSGRFTASSADLLAGESAHPEWLVKRWVAEFGLHPAQAICSYDQRIPNTTIRLDDAEAEQELQSEGISVAPGSLLASTRIIVSGDITRRRAFLEGRVFIQDEASQLVAALVGRGSRLLDCCAAPGGKTAALAARNPSAQIVAAELHPHRAKLLRKRVRAANVQVLRADALDSQPQTDSIACWRTCRAREPERWLAILRSNGGLSLAILSTCTPSRLRSCVPRCSSLRPEDARCIPPVRWNGKRTKLWSRRCCKANSNTNCSIAEKSWSACVQVANWFGMISARSFEGNSCAPFRDCSHATDSSRP